MARLCIFILSLFNIFKLGKCLAFEKNKNLTEDLLKNAANGNQSVQDSVLGCARFCVYADLNITCNGFVFNEEEKGCYLLDLNRIDRLEDNSDNPIQGLQIFTDLKMRFKLPLYCNGGKDTYLLANIHIQSI